jgi:hypothetical protein
LRGDGKHRSADLEVGSAIFAVCLEAAVFTEMKTGISIDNACGVAVSWMSLVRVLGRTAVALLWPFNHFCASRGARAISGFV